VGKALSHIRAGFLAPRLPKQRDTFESFDPTREDINDFFNESPFLAASLWHIDAEYGVLPKYGGESDLRTKRTIRKVPRLSPQVKMKRAARLCVRSGSWFRVLFATLYVCRRPQASRPKSPRPASMRVAGSGIVTATRCPRISPTGFFDVWTLI
jgi:hypothetical protein